MANNAVYTQLPILVKRPQAVWPGLDRMDLHRNNIAGDGNCLFASLADQLYGAPTRHPEIRADVIGYMREMREDFEGVALVDDIQQKRATRRDTSAIRQVEGFEGYLAIMSKHGTYGGEPELNAFVRCYDQDVTVHLPHGSGINEIGYTNIYRDPKAVVKPRLHICYDNKIAHAHYDSMRTTRSRTAVVDSDTSKGQVQAATTLNARAARHNRADMMKTMRLENLTESDRATSPSVSSSQYSTSSKRSFEEDAEPQRARKRIDRKSRMHPISDKPFTKLLQSTSNKTKLKSGLATPASTQDGEYSSSDQSEHNASLVEEAVVARPRRRLVRGSRSTSRESQSSITNLISHDGKINAESDTAARHKSTKAARRANPTSGIPAELETTWDLSASIQTITDKSRCDD